MPINERGEYVRSEEAPKETPENEMRRVYESATSSQNNLPQAYGEVQPQGVLYYGPQHIDAMEQAKATLVQLATEQNVQEFLASDGATKIKISAALAEIQRNLDFSKSVHTKLG